MAAEGLLVISLGQIKVQASGRRLIRNVCMVFDRYISTGGTQAFSKAI
jgi:coproporphyrinogen III oxidase-like Fe-S oxidoreductase